MKRWKSILGWAIAISLLLVPSLFLAYHLGWVDNIFGVLGVVFLIMTLSGVAANFIKH